MALILDFCYHIYSRIAAAKTHPFICQRSFISKKKLQFEETKGQLISKQDCLARQFCFEINWPLRPPSIQFLKLIQQKWAFLISNFLNAKKSLANKWWAISFTEFEAFDWYVSVDQSKKVAEQMAMHIIQACNSWKYKKF